MVDVATASETDKAKPRAIAAAKMDRSAVSWALYEAARNPYVILCTIYVLAPYIATTVIGDPVKGQELISGWNKLAGFIVALTAPFLGAAADRIGNRKPILLLVTALMCPLIFAMWWAEPGGTGLSIAAIGFLITAVSVLFAYNEVFHNSMLTRASTPQNLAATSGMGLALGNAASVIMLVIVLFAFAMPGRVDLPFLPSAPLFGLDASTHEPDRIVAPIVAVFFALMAIPLFLFSRDGMRSSVSWPVALRDGVAGVARTIAKLKDHRNVALFLAARMLYADGKTAILIFGGIYAAGVMGWGLIEMTAYGIILSIFAVGGGFLGGWLDNKIGAKTALVVEIGVTLACLIFLVSMQKDAIFFVVPVDPAATVWASEYFNTLPELLYLGGACLIAVSITAAYASSRTMMARLCPPGMEGELFGLYALSGAATVWLGPMLVEYFTATYKTQQAGFGSISILLVAGFAVLLFVKPPEVLKHQ